ncbi:hypothetical protein LTR56_001828 [Elasticomyces elasticus]|nr:hypothetical protein LTR56_001828 [Elasticomyces elasticus]KAK3668821.1 hypothetical protein LTR22_000301 [Elasticomyces elasticus]KAK4924938.1 hypothetical protein LTR49_007944 [Elasticomyces elasticus]KAK5763194.1 hypothetical protein LTS12_006578 [Elasticomyces elasticus]
MFAIQALTLCAALAGSVIAAPTKRANIDTTVLQFALTLEHLENVFYKQALEKFSLKEFEQAGYSANYYNNLKYIAHDEEEHVKLLSGALTAAGVKPVQACTYKFPYTDVRSFITLSSVLEGVGTSAYLGGAPLITSKDYLTVAGSILVTEALHTSMQRSAIDEVPMANPYGTPLDPTSVYTLAAMFIESCPASNAALPFKPFPSLQVDGVTSTCEEPECGKPRNDVKREEDYACAPPSAGNSVTFTAAGDVAEGSYLTFVSGLDVVSVSGTVQGKNITAEVPMQAQGQTYVFVTSKSEGGKLVAADVTYGPAILEVNPPAPTIDYAESK